MGDKETKNETKTGALSTQPDARKQFNRKWYPCIAVAAVIFLLMIIGGALTLRAYLAGYESDKKTETPVPEDQTNPNTTPDTKSTPKTTPKPKSTPSPDTSSAEKEKMINFFLETALSDSTDRELYVIRWTKPSVSVGVATGTFDDQLNSCLDGFIADFNGLTSSMNLYHDNTVDLGIPNIKIFYIDDATFVQRARGVSPYAYVSWYLNDDSSIQRITMDVSYKIKETDPVVQCQIIRHEMMHAVGFWGHSDIYPESIMSLPKSDYRYPVVDRRLVELLYNIGLTVGTNPADTRSYLNNNYPY